MGERAALTNVTGAAFRRWPSPMAATPSPRVVAPARLLASTRSVGFHGFCNLKNDDT
jgi:hypothetical protein